MSRETLETLRVVDADVHVHEDPAELAEYARPPWDVALRENRGTVNPLGLYDLDRNIRPVGVAYRDLIKAWRTLLPTQSVCLSVPVEMPSEQNEQLARLARRHVSHPHHAQPKV